MTFPVARREVKWGHPWARLFGMSRYIGTIPFTSPGGRGLGNAPGRECRRYDTTPPGRWTRINRRGQAWLRLQWTYETVIGRIACSTSRMTREIADRGIRGTRYVRGGNRVMCPPSPALGRGTTGRGSRCTSAAAPARGRSPRLRVGGGIIIVRAGPSTIFLIRIATIPGAIRG